MSKHRRSAETFKQHNGILTNETFSNIAYLASGQKDNLQNDLLSDMDNAHE